MDGDWLFGFMTKLSGEVGDGGQGPDGAAAHLAPLTARRELCIRREGASPPSRPPPSSFSATALKVRLQHSPSTPPPPFLKRSTLSFNRVITHRGRVWSARLHRPGALMTTFSLPPQFPVSLWLLLTCGLAGGSMGSRLISGALSSSIPPAFIHLSHKPNPSPPPPSAEGSGPLAGCSHRE